MSDSVPLRKSFYKKILYFLILTLFPLSIASKSKDIPFLRTTDMALQTTVYTLTSKETNVRIKIIGVVHVADKEYYQNIQKMINDLDYLFYEGIRLSDSSQSNDLNHKYPLQLVTETVEELNTKKSIRKFTDLKIEIAKLLNFADQTDFLKPQENWINADMDFIQFVDVLKDYKIGFDALSTNFSIESNSMSKDFTEIINMNAIDNPVYNQKIGIFKKKMSQNLVKSAKDLCYLEEMRLARDAIIIERNKFAIGFLKPKFTSIAPLELGILYGVAHTPNFVEILTHEYNFEIESYEWLDAWSLQN